MTCSIVWFRRDLRLTDNPALRAACADADSVIPLYIHDPEGEGAWRSGAASRAWLHDSLVALDEGFRALGSRLLACSGDSPAVLGELARTHGAGEVHASSAVEPRAMAVEQAVRDALQRDGVELVLHRSNEWLSPHEILTGGGTPYKVFTPFWRQFQARFQPRQPVAPPPSVPPLPDGIAATGVDDLSLRTGHPWEERVMSHWTPGEAGAAAALERFSERVAQYDARRDFPAEPATSSLSPHLAFGEISPVQLVAAVLAPLGGELLEPAASWVRQLAWREFARYLLVHFSGMTDRAWRPEWDRFPWADDDEVLLVAWRRGRTGVPIVDAGMRQLWQTGWMHNRVRMIVASYLCKHLGQHWLQGARWFWDTLVDADLANNSMGWQWVAGSGPDAAPYFRIFNPETQGMRFDPEARYLRAWLPSHRLRDGATAKQMHATSVDLASGRNAAMERYRQFKALAQDH